MYEITLLRAAADILENVLLVCSQVGPPTGFQSVAFASPCMDALQEVLHTGDAVDKDFSAAGECVAAVASSGRLDNEALLALYGLYKQATEGACTSFRPSFFNQKARSKW